MVLNIAYDPDIFITRTPGGSWTRAGFVTDEVTDCHGIHDYRLLLRVRGLSEQTERVCVQPVVDRGHLLDSNRAGLYSAAGGVCTMRHTKGAGASHAAADVVHLERRPLWSRLSVAELLAGGALSMAV